MNFLSISSNKTIEKCKSFSSQNWEGPREVIFIASYPKSGTTWMQTIVYNILSEFNQDFDHISLYSPFFEIDPTWESDGNEISKNYCENFKKLGCAIFNTHLPFEYMPYSPHFKYIYMIRNAKDVCYSFFQHLSHQNNDDIFTLGFDQFLDEWLAGKIVFGKWADHIKSWMQNNELKESLNINSQILYVKYEDLKLDTKRALMKIASFLGRGDIDIEKLVGYSSFEYMKQNENKFQPISVPWKDGFKFIRKGIIGDGAVAFDEKKSEMLLKSICESFGTEGTIPLWLDELNVLN